MNDQAAAHQLELERQERIVDAIYEAAMRGLPEDDCKILCAECGVSWKLIESTQKDRNTQPLF